MTSELRASLRAGFIILRLRLFEIEFGLEMFVWRHEARTAVAEGFEVCGVSLCIPMDLLAVCCMPRSQDVAGTLSHPVRCLRALLS
jgi:hypothetical protein